MTRSPAVSVVAALALVVVCGGCAAGDAAGRPSSSPTMTLSPGDDPTKSPSDPADDGKDDDELAKALDCLQGDWSEDMVNLLAQWQNWSPAGQQALPVTGLSGQNKLTVTGESMIYTVDTLVTTEMTMGPGMKGEAVTNGSATFDYAVQSPTIVTVGPVTVQEVSSITRVYVGGELSSETVVPWDGGIQGEAIWWCEGDTLSLEPDVSGWIHLFTRG